MRLVSYPLCLRIYDGRGIPYSPSNSYAWLNLESNKGKEYYSIYLTTGSGRYRLTLSMPVVKFMLDLSNSKMRPQTKQMKKILITEEGLKRLHEKAYEAL